MVSVIHSFEKLPHFWSQSVIFFANIYSIFFANISATKRLYSEVRGVKTYGGRLLPILNILFNNSGTGSQNAIVLEAAPNSQLMSYMSDSLNLKMPAINLMDKSNYLDFNRDTVTSIIENFKNTSYDCIDGFVTDRKLEKIAEYIGIRTVSSFDGSKNGNNKLLLHKYLKSAGLPVFDTEYPDCPEDVDEMLTRLKKKGYSRAVIKSQIGATGYGMLKIDINSNSMPVISKDLFFEGPCMLQGWKESTESNYSPSIQMFLDNNSVYLYDLTEQILNDESIHEGNMSPPSYLSVEHGLHEELCRQAGIAGQWLHDQGYRGTSSVDFLIEKNCGKVTVYICEINARVTGATYPSILARYLMNNGAWIMRNISFRRPLDSSDLLKLLDSAGLLYHLQNTEGLIPINFNQDQNGMVSKGQFLSIGPDMKVCNHLLSKTESILPVEWGYDRD